VWGEHIEQMMSPCPGEQDAGKFPHHKKWHERMMKRPAVKKLMEDEVKTVSQAIP
jgi:glutathione S-transferase